MKNLKNLPAYIAIFALMFLLFAFISLEIDPSKWRSGERLIVVVYSFLGCVLWTPKNSSSKK